MYGHARKQFFIREAHSTGWTRFATRQKDPQHTHTWWKTIKCRSTTSLHFKTLCWKKKKTDYNKLELGNSQLPLSLQRGRETGVGKKKGKKKDTDMVCHNNNDILRCAQLDCKVSGLRIGSLTNVWLHPHSRNWSDRISPVHRGHTQLLHALPTRSIFNKSTTK